MPFFCTITKPKKSVYIDFRDWAIAFNEGSVKHVYFVAETKGSMQSLQLKSIEKAKIDCARVHFKAISSDTIQYDVVDNYESLLDKVMR